MSVSVPIQQSKVPINFDLIIVCRKTKPDSPHLEQGNVSLSDCLNQAKDVVKTLQSVSIQVSSSDVWVILMGCLLSKLSAIGNLSKELSFILDFESKADQFAQEFANQQSE
jgi:hypothetical protein